MGLKSKLFGPEPKFRRPRIWSNDEIRKLAPLCDGSIVNVSGWKDEDKLGNKYKDYFVNANNYAITNYSSSHKGFQGNTDEIALNLVGNLPEELNNKFDTVFNHTTLEHIFEVQKAFENLSLMAKDNLLVIVPFMQQQHGPDYGDFWRFTPLVIEKLMNKNGLELSYINYNDSHKESIYIVAVGNKSKEGTDKFKKIDGNKLDVIDSSFIGTNIIKRSFLGFRFN